MKSENFLLANFCKIVNTKTIKTDRRIIGDTESSNLGLNPLPDLKGRIIDISFSRHLILCFYS